MGYEYGDLLEIARASLQAGAWRRADLQEIAAQHGMPISDRQANKIIGTWKDAGIADHYVNGKEHTYLWSTHYAVPETPQTDRQMHAHSRASTHDEMSARFWDAGLIARVLAASTLALAVLAGAWSSVLNWQPTVVQTPQATPNVTRVIVTATPAPAPARMIPSYHAPEGQYAGDVPLPDPQDVIARYDGARWVNIGSINAPRWVRSGDWIGVDLALVPDLQPTPTPQVQIIYQPMPVAPAPATPAPAQAPAHEAAPVAPTSTPAPAREAAPATNAIAERTIDPGSYTLACSPSGCSCHGGLPDDNNLVIVLAGISLETCQREAGN